MENKYLGKEYLRKMTSTYPLICYGSSKTNKIILKEKQQQIAHFLILIY